ncbi:DUF1444 family protein [Actinocorallia populi]|uniref:DUF1444 family protein n=1 Tax=Actinocorallia populi TaxID=2079200 RepID=UPI000D08D041|nr:DUF1444 family protein [Actinocorallia populi]
MSEPYDLIVPILGARVPVDVKLDFPLPPDEAPLREPLSGDLYLTYGLDHPPSEDGRIRFEPVTPRMVRELGLEPGQLRARASGNLRVRRPDLALNWFPGVQAVTVTVGGDLEAGLLLDEPFLEKIAAEVDGELVVGVPARDVFTATGSRDEQGLAKLRWVADRVWARGDHLLSRHLLVRRDGHWLPLG